MADHGYDVADAVEEPPKEDPLRPEARRGRYYLPDPVTGETRSWQRVTNFVKNSDDTYHLELWKQRNVAKGVAMMIESGRVGAADLAGRDVKADKNWINNVASAAQDEADAYKNADEGTALHKSAELADFAGGDLNRVPERHRVKIRLYLDALAAHGLAVVPEMIERVTSSADYDVAGKFDRICREASGEYVMVDLKTGDSVDLAMPSIAAQLDSYVNGVNKVGIFDGQRYDTSLKVRTDYGIVIHLPSTRDEVSVIRVDLDHGRAINAVNLSVRDARKIKARHVASPYVPAVRLSPDGLDMYWLERLNAAQDYQGLVEVAQRAKSFGQWDERLASQARLLAAELDVV